MWSRDLSWSVTAGDDAGREEIDSGPLEVQNEGKRGKVNTAHLLRREHEKVAKTVERGNRGGGKPLEKENKRSRGRHKQKRQKSAH